MGDLTGLVAVCLIFGVPVIAILTEHQRKVMQMKLKLREQEDEGLRGELDSLKREIQSLRDTSTQYDISLDANMQRLEGRVARLESHTITSQSASASDTESARVRIGN